MKKINKLHAIAVLVLLISASCAWLDPEAEHPALVVGIHLTETQMALQQEYIAVWHAADDDQREFLASRVAPLLDEAKHMIAEYNDAVLEERPPEYQDYEIRGMLAGIIDLMGDIQND